jgi:hypothetical protein
MFDMLRMLQIHGGFSQTRCRYFFLALSIAIDHFRTAAAASQCYDEGTSPVDL